MKPTFKSPRRSTRQPTQTRRKPRRDRALRFEQLEERVLLATNVWQGGAAGNWNTDANWSDGIPTSDDDVVVDEMGTQTVAITINSGANVANTITMSGDDSLSVVNSSLTLGGGASTISNLALSGGALFANAAVSLTGTGSFSGSATMGGAAAITNNGTLGITSGDPNLQTELVNAGIIQHGNAFLDLDGAAARLRVVSGGLYETVTTGSGFSFRPFNSPAGVFIEAGGVLRQNTSNGADFNIGAGVPFSVDGGTLQTIGAGTSALNLNGVGVFTNASLEPSVGSTINFGNDNTVVGTITGAGAGAMNLASGVLHADAAGAVLNFPAGLFNWSGSGSLSGPGVFTNTGTIQITSGDPNLTTELVNAGTIKHGNGFLDLDGAAANLRTISGGVYETVTTGSGFSFRASNGAPGVFIEAGGLLRQNTSNGADFSIGAGVPFSVNGGTLEAAGVGTSPLNLNGAGVLTNAILVTAAGKTINFGNDNTVVGTITGSGAGAVNLASGALHADAAGATLNFPAGLFNWSGSGTLAGPGVFTNTGTIQITGGDPNLTTELVNAATIRHGNAFLDLDGAAAKLRTISGGLYETVTTGSGFSFRASNGTPGVFIEAGGLLRQSTSNGADFSIGAGVPFSVNGGTLQTAGAGTSPLNLNGVGVFTNANLVTAASTTINFSNENTVVGALGGSGAGAVNLASGQLHATAAGAELSFPAGIFNWSGSGTLAGPGVFTNTGTIQITGGDPNLTTELVNAGTIRHGNAFLDLDGAAAMLRTIAGGVYETVTTGSGFSFRQFNSTPGVFVEAGAILRQATTNGADFSIGAGVPFAVQGGTVQTTGAGSSQLNLNGAGTFTNATLSPNAGTIINFGNENTVVGTLGGSGAGAVNLASGQLHATAAGATLNFPTGLFNLSGSGSLSWPGVFTNAGSLQITSGDPNLTTELVNAGTIKHGNAFLDLDGAAVKVRTIAGGLYETVTTGSGFSFRVANGSPGVFVEAGATFRQNTPNGADFSTGAATAFSNLGKVEVARGALNFSTAPAQISGASGTATLTGGAWEVANAATLNLGITGLRTNAAELTVRGTGVVSGFAALAASSGALSLLAGADLTTAQAFTNSGALTLSAGSVLTAPSFTQSAAGSTAFEIGGTAAAQLGRIAAAGAATLAGTARITVVDGFDPQVGQTFPLMTFGSRNGAFANVAGLNVGHANIFEAIHSATNFSLNSLVNASDLAVETVSTPGPVAAGNDVSFSYTVRNTGAFVTPVAAWSDTVYLSKDGVLDATDIVLTRVAHNGTVAAGDTYTANVTVPLTGALPDDYRIIVVADAQGRVADTDRADNTLASAGSFALSIPALTAGVPFSGSIVSGRDQFFQFTVPAGQTPKFTFTGAVMGQAELFASLGKLPTRADYDEAAFDLRGTVQRIAGDLIVPGTYFILVHGRENAGAGQAFSLVASSVGFELDTTSVAGGANIGSVTTTLIGSQFTPDTTFTLVPSSGPSRAASATYFASKTEVTATFDLTGLAAGAYSIVAQKGVSVDTLANAFSVTAGGTPGTLSFAFSLPRAIRPPFRGTAATITYENTGQTDLDAPLFHLFTTNARVRLDGQAGFVEGTYTGTGGELTGVFELLGTSGGLAGVLSPGEKGSITMFFEPVNATPRSISRFELDVIEPSSLTMPWDEAKDDMQPLGMPDDAWDAVFANFIADIGTTFASYKAELIEDANYLGQFGPVSPDVLRLISFELEQADDFSAVSERFTSGAFGRGRLAPFSQHVETDEFGNVNIIEGQTSRGFVPLAGGAYRGTGADMGQLTRAANGAFTLDEGDGTKTVFRASDGRIDFIEDANGRRFTAAWNAGGLLTSVTDSLNGDATTYTQNAQGRIVTETDPVGRVTTYGYDAGGEHLTSVTTTAGTTTFTYSATGHRITSATGPDGVTVNYGYDAAGRHISTTTGSGPGAVTVEFARSGPGLTTITDGDGNTSHIFRAAVGRLGRTVDALGRVSNFGYDAMGRIASVTDPDGLVTKRGFDAQGDIAGATGGDRAASNLDIGGGIRRLKSVTDPGGDTTRFTYDARGNLVSTLLPDGFGASYEYDAQGRVVAATNSNGERATFTYDADGLLTQRVLPGGGTVTFTYDAHRNLLTATDVEGATTFTYDAADRITSVAYPNGKTVSLTYDAAGRRSTVSDGSYTVKYSYDSFGRLDTVRDGADALLVDYGYTTLGQLAIETRGNGATTTYTYDALGRAETITHRDAASAVTESFTYAYTASGKIASVTTGAGTTNYSYDTAAQLTGVTLPGGRTQTFAYDAEGNRVTTSDSASGSENYTTNSGDQYTAAGAAMLAYDRDGRIIARTVGGVTTSYTYDASGRLAGITSPGSVVAYDYDALGNRIAVIEDGVRTDFVLDPSGLGNVFGEYQGVASTHYAAGLGIAARIAAGGASYYHFDAIGNTALVSGAGGAATATYSYLPFGEIAAQTGADAQPFTFGGRNGVLDDAGNLFHMRARMYDAELGRFTSRDPIGFAGGDSNLYRYVQNDPVNSADPSGLQLPNIPVGGLPPLKLPGRPVQAAVRTGLGLIRGPAGSGTSGLVRTGLQTGIRATGVFAGTPAPIGPIPTPVPPGAPPPAALAGAGIFGDGSLTLVGTASAGTVLAAGTLTAGAGFIAGSAIDRYNERNNPEFQRGLREGLANYDPFSPNGLGNEHAVYEDFGAIDKDYNRLVQKSGSSELFQMLYKQKIRAGLMPEDAFLKAKAEYRKALNNALYPPPKTGQTEVVRPSDPNNVLGPAGAGADPVPDIIGPGQVRFDGFVGAGGSYGYRIEFENQPSATAPAQVVHVTQTLDADLDLSTFAFTSFSFGAFLVSVPAGAIGSSFNSIVDATATLGVLVQLDAAFDTQTGILDVTFNSLDPATNDVPFDPFAGFLPPDDGSGAGDGFLTYTVAPKSGLANDTDFTALASIVFDTEAAIATPTVTNTLDTVAPTSSVDPLPTTTFATAGRFTVSWSGRDDTAGPAGSGIAFFDVFVSDNDGLFTAFQEQTPATSATFTGQFGHTYGFFSVATDNVGLRQPTPAAAQTVTTVEDPGPHVTDARINANAARKAIADIVLTFDEALTESAAENPASYILKLAGKDKRFGTPDDVTVPTAPGVYDAALLTVTLTPQSTKPIKLNQFLRVTASGTGGVTSLGGAALDGDLNNAPGGDFVRSLGLGTKLSFPDPTGDVVALTLKKGGLIELSLPATGDPTVRLTGTVAGTSSLTGTVKKPKTGASDGRATIASITGSAGVNTTGLVRCSPALTTNCLVIGSISAMVVDAILESDRVL